jgi:hypothetical protein
MPALKVKKVVAVCFLEAAKTTLEHLGAHRLALSQDGATGPPDLARTYGEVRRLRDYLQRCASAYQDQVELDMAESDQPLLVACCRRSVEAIDLRLAGSHPLKADESEWLRKKRQVVADWAVELAGHPLLELPLNPLSSVQPEASRTLLVRLHQRVQAQVLQQAGVMPDMAPNTESLGDQPTAMAPLEESIEMTRLAAEDPEPDHASPANLLDSHKLRDPRLRALVAMDLRSYERVADAGDYRLAVVLLASVLESALLDHVLLRRAEFGLTGSPETWNPQELLIRAMGEQCAPRDRAMVYHLFSARSLLRPALQMITPTIVTVASFGALREFVQRALHHMGFSLNLGESEADQHASATASGA